MLLPKSGTRSHTTSRAISGRLDASCMRWPCWDLPSKQILPINSSRRSRVESMRNYHLPTAKSCLPSSRNWWPTTRRSGHRLKKFCAIQRWWIWNRSANTGSNWIKICWRPSNSPRTWSTSTKTCPSLSMIPGARPARSYLRLSIRPNSRPSNPQPNCRFPP